MPKIKNAFTVQLPAKEDLLGWISNMLSSGSLDLISHGDPDLYRIWIRCQQGRLGLVYGDLMIKGDISVLERKGAFLSLQSVASHVIIKYICGFTSENLGVVILLNETLNEMWQLNWYPSSNGLRLSLPQNFFRSECLWMWMCPYSQIFPAIFTFCWPLLSWLNYQFLFCNSLFIGCSSREENLPNCHFDHPQALVSSQFSLIFFVIFLLPPLAVVCTM